MAGAVGALDEAVKEYLLYRGFTQTLKYFEMERRDDKDKGFRVRRIGAGSPWALIRSFSPLVNRGVETRACADKVRETPPPRAGESNSGVHHAVCVQVRLPGPPELLDVPVQEVLQPDEQRISHCRLQIGDQHAQVSAVCSAAQHSIELHTL